jgi:hypothetical protein
MTSGKPPDPPLLQIAFAVSLNAHLHNEFSSSFDGKNQSVKLAGPL